MSINGNLTGRQEICGRDVRVTGRLLRKATVWDEEWLDGTPVADPGKLVAALKGQRVADVFTFCQALPDPGPRLNYPAVIENAAVVDTRDFPKWWEGLPQEARKNVRRSQRRGVETRATIFDDNLVRGITMIYNELPIRQGRKFWHYGKQFETVKAENSTYLDRSIFVGAYLGEELIGFVKIVKVNNVGRIMQILALERHNDKRPMNAMIARAVELCSERQLSHFIYGRYVYGNKENSPMTEFKRRNGFERLDYPRYFVPLTPLGAMAVRCGLHLGVSQLLPEWVLNSLLKWRAAFYARKFGAAESGRTACSTEEKALT